MATTIQVMGGLNLSRYIISHLQQFYVLTQMAAVPSKIVVITIIPSVIEQSSCGIHITKFKF
jgi:hypothetical protein